MHCAARAGAWKAAHQLSGGSRGDSGGAQSALKTRNSAGETPSQTAKRCGWATLAFALDFGVLRHLPTFLNVFLDNGEAGVTADNR